MTLDSDIVGDTEPEAESASPASDVPARTHRPRGHYAKIAEAVAELQAEGTPLTTMRPTYRNKLILDRIEAKGHGGDLPSPRAIGRAFEVMMQSA
jgi:hypothetical protein